MKQRYTSLDLMVISHELSQALIGFRLSNIYDISSRIFLLKFALPNSKHLLLIDSGFRCHLTSFSRAASPSPSSFVARLRKHLRTRRITSIRQVGTDRVLEFTFSDGKYKLYLEFYAGGNVVLVNEEGICIAVLRIVTADEAGGRDETKVGSAYVTSEGRDGLISLGSLIDREMVIEALKAQPQVPQEEEAVEASTPLEDPTTKKGKAKPGQGKKNKKKKGEDALKRVLSIKVPEFSPTLIEHALNIVGISADLRAEDVLKDDTLVDKVLEAFLIAKKVIEEVTNPASRAKGYIIAKKRRPQIEGQEAVAKPKGKTKDHTVFGEIDVLFDDEDPEENAPEMKTDADGFRYDDFHPFLPKQFLDTPNFKIIEVEGYNNTVDTFFSSIESLKLTTRLQDRKLAAIKRLTSARSEHQSRVNALQNVQTLNERKARAIEANLDKVEEAIVAVNSLIYQGVDWKGVETMISNARRAGNPVAELISGLKLSEGTLTLVLAEDGVEEGEESDEDDADVSESEEESDDEAFRKRNKKEQQKLNIEVKLALSGWANAREYYHEKKAAAVKEEKTISASTKALKNTERKVLTDLKKGLNKEKQLLRPVRQQMWFEKFYFFISTDGYLVLGGRDAQQTDLLYQRHFKRGDILVSAEMDGAATLIVKNQNTHILSDSTTGPPPIPPTTLSQAGTFSICASKAWESKAVMSAWWVNWDQVSKTVKETGDYVEEIGKLIITGTKNYLPPAQLALGYGVLWVTGEGVQDTAEGRETASLESEAVTEGHEEDAKDEQGAEDGEEEEQQEEEDSDEDFPDVQIQSAGEESDADAKEGETRDEISETAETSSVPTGPGLLSEGAEAQIAEDQDDSATSAQLPQATGKKHLSAKERRESRKGKSGQPGAEPSPSHSSAPSKTTKDFSKSSLAQVQSQSPQAQASRGKRHTTKYKKKLAEKYALLSDDEREIARELLGVGGAAPSGTGTPSLDTGGKTLSKEDERAAEELAQRQRKREQHLRAQALGKASEAKRFGWTLPGVSIVTIPAVPANVPGPNGNKDEGDDTGDVLASTEDQQDDASIDLTCLTGIPTNAAHIIEAIPICAPYSALGRYKYKVKLLPAVGGASREAQKKGKAVKDIIWGWIRIGEPVRPGTSGGKGGIGGGAGKGRGVGMGFVGWDEQGKDEEKMWPKEWDLLKNWRTEESLNCVPVGRLRVVGGLSTGGKGEGGRAGSGAKGKSVGGKSGKFKDKDDGGKGGKGGKKK